MATSKLYVDPEQLAKADKDEYSNAFARIENHYFINDVRLIALWSVRLLLSIHSYIL